MSQDHLTRLGARSMSLSPLLVNAVDDEKFVALGKANVANDSRDEECVTANSQGRFHLQVSQP